VPSRIDYNNPRPDGSLGLAYHYEMLTDDARVRPFKAAITSVCENRRVFESGTGTGLFAILAARAGARAVYATENDPAILEFARANIARERRGVVRLIEKDTLDVTLADLDAERVDVVIAEHLSTWQVTEPEVPILNHINAHLASSECIRLPSRITNQAELTEARYEVESGIMLRTHFFEFSGVRRARTLTPIHVFEALDLSKPMEESVCRSIRFRVRDSGEANSVRLTSPLEVYQELTFGASDSLVPPVVAPLETPVTVRAGDCVEVMIEYETCSTWESFRARVVGRGNAAR
jgi:predicted RNA methylase